MSNYVVSDTNLTAIANKIRSKTGGSSQLEFPTDFVNDIDTLLKPSGTKSISQNGTGIDVASYASVDVNVSGGEEIEPKDVVFIDYDGSIIHNYTKAEFLALSDMPTNPSHTGLTAQGWNWTLADAKAYVNAHGMLVIGQQYVTSDGKTKIYLTIDNPNFLTVQIHCKATDYTALTVNWGDGQSSTMTSASQYRVEHTYSSVGDYIVTIEVSTGTYYLGYNGSNTSILGGNNATQLYVRKIEIGKDVSQLYKNVCRYMARLETITIPKNTLIDSVNEYAFNDCISLKAIVFPVGSNAVANNIFSDCSSLKILSYPKWSGSAINANLNINFNRCQRLVMLTAPEAIANSGKTIDFIFTNFYMKKCVIPFSCESLASSFLRDCRSLLKFVVPSTVTTIASYAISSAVSLQELHMLPTSPPSLNNVNALGGGGSNRIIYIPYSNDHSILNAYQTATNWSTYASQMQEEPQT